VSIDRTELHPVVTPGGSHRYVVGDRSVADEPLEAALSPRMER
jgi:hypothetical protein